MRSVKMIAKRAGTCTCCHQPITAGQSIWWQRGAGAHHVDCQTAKLTAGQCTSCKGSGRRWNNAPCPQCDGTGSRKVADFARAGGHQMADPMGVDTAYEDNCRGTCPFDEE